MQLKFISVGVDDQDKALAFYTRKLGSSKMADIPMSPITALLFKDGCGNLINLVQPQ